VAIVGAGNGDDLPLERIAERAAEVVLLDIDPTASRSAIRRLPRSARRKVEAIGHDVTQGAADRIVLAAARPAPADDTGRSATVDPERPGAASDPLAGAGAFTPADPLAAADPKRSSPVEALPGAPYDLAVGDLFYSQLLYPALLDLEVPKERRDEVLAAAGPGLTRRVVARLHASAPAVVHLHDPLAWWEGHEQPFALEQVLDAAEDEGLAAALALVAEGAGPTETDPRTALAELGLTPAATAFWRWPFAPDVDYLACATLATG
jgi:hypothetical protein